MAACEEAVKIGYLMVPPIGDEGSGLKVEEAKEAVQILQSTPLGSEQGVVVIGPLDGTASKRSSDALLKTLEDGGSGFVTPILWASDLEEVPLTIRSRCLSRWAGLSESVEENEEVTTAAWAAVSASLRKDIPALLGSLRILSTKEAKTAPFLRALTECLSSDLGKPEYRLLWERIRPLMKLKDVVAIEVLACLLGE